MGQTLAGHGRRDLVRFAGAIVIAAACAAWQSPAALAQQSDDHHHHHHDHGGSWGAGGGSWGTWHSGSGMTFGASSFGGRIRYGGLTLLPYPIYTGYVPGLAGPFMPAPYYPPLAIPAASLYGPQHV